MSERQLQQQGRYSQGGGGDMRTSLVGKHGHTSGEPTAWSQGLCADPLRGCVYQIPCFNYCVGAPQAVKVVNRYLAKLGSVAVFDLCGGCTCCGCCDAAECQCFKQYKTGGGGGVGTSKETEFNVGGLCCYVCCPAIAVMGSRRNFQAKHKLSGGECSNCALGCCAPGCALRQMEHQAEAYTKIEAAQRLKMQQQAALANAAPGLPVRPLGAVANFMSRIV